MTTTTLHPGVTLHAINENRFKNEYLSVNFLVSGELYERAHALLLCPVMLSGSERYQSEADLERALCDLYDADLYQEAYALGETLIKPFSLQSAVDRFLPPGASVRKEARDLLCACILRPLVENGGFRRRYVNNQKKNKLDQLKAEKINRPRYAARRCMELLCAGEPIALPTKQLKKDLKNVDAVSLYAYYQRLLREAPIEIFYAGEQDPQALAEDLRARLGNLFTDKKAPTPDRVSLPKEKIVRKTEHFSGSQSTLCLGYKTPILQGGADFTALSLMREMLCVSPLSLIFMNVREKQSLCYYCQDRLLARKGVYMLSCGIDGRDAPTAEDAIDRQIAALAAGEFPEQLLIDCKRMMINSLSAVNDNPQAIEGWYIRRLLAGDMKTPAEEQASIRALTREDVMRAAASLTKDSVFLLRADKKAAV